MGSTTQRTYSWRLLLGLHCHADSLWFPERQIRAEGYGGGRDVSGGYFHHHHPTTGQRESVPVARRESHYWFRRGKYHFSMFRQTTANYANTFMQSKRGTCSPVHQKSKICFLMLPVPQYCLCSIVLLKIWPLFPCSPEINALFPLFTKTCGRA